MISAEGKTNAGTESSEGRRSMSLYVLFAVMVVDLLGFTVILPLLPSIFEHYRSNKEDHIYHWLEGRVQYFQKLLGAPDDFNGVLFGGFLGSVFCTMQFFAAPIFGSLSDVYGRKPILILASMGMALSHAVWYFSDCFGIYTVARVIGGLSRSSTSISAAVITDLCPQKQRGRGMALIGIAFGVGFIVGPMIGAFFASRGAHSAKFYAMPATFAFCMAVLDILLLVFCLKESLPKEKRASSVGQGLAKAYQFISPSSLFSFSPVIGLKQDEKRAVQRIGMVYFLFLFIYSGLEYSLSFLAHSRFGFDRMQQGKMYLFSGLIIIFIQGGYVRRIPSGKEIRNAAIGTILIIPSFIIIGLSERVIMFYVGLALYSYASATVVPCLTTVVSNFGSDSQKGTILGIFRSLGYLARTLGPMTFALAYWSLTPKVSYTIGGISLSVPLMLTLNLHKVMPQKLD